MDNSRAYTIRTCGVFGGKTGSRIKKGNFVLYILNEAKKHTSLEVSSDQIASFVNASDLARVTISLLQRRYQFKRRYVLGEHARNHTVKLGNVKFNGPVAWESEFRMELQALSNARKAVWVLTAPWTV